MKRDKVVKSIPNVCTMCNAICGLTAMLIAVFYREPSAIAIASVLIFLGMMFDFSDGFLARKLKAQSPIGKELDSLADAITFGIAPVVIFISLQHTGNSELVFFELILTAFFAMCAVYRLARYNITESKGYFEGVPTTLAGGLLALYVLISSLTIQYWEGNIIYCYISYAFIILLGFGMISKFRVNRIGKKVKKDETVELTVAEAVE